MKKVSDSRDNDGHHVVWFTNFIYFIVFSGDLGGADLNVESLCWGTGEGEDSGFRDNMVGKVIGGDDKYSLAKTAVEDEEAPEPLALLAIHAAMHMLFLPQFTCDFYEEQENDNDSVSSEESGRSEHKNEPGFLEQRRLEAEKAADASQLKEDGVMMNEAGLKKTKYAVDGIILQPKPACIVWSAGCGIKKKKVSFYSISSYGMFSYVKHSINNVILLPK